MIVKSISQEMSRANPEAHRDDEAEKAKIQSDLQTLTKRLAQVNDSIQRKNETRIEYDKVIQETEAAYLKILESSQTLLTVLKREAVNIQKKKQASS
jgi:Sjoegren syndrome nuclear autoantigen 1